MFLTSNSPLLLVHIIQHSIMDFYWPLIKLDAQARKDEKNITGELSSEKAWWPVWMTLSSFAIRSRSPRSASRSAMMSFAYQIRPHGMQMPRQILLGFCIPAWASCMSLKRPHCLRMQRSSSDRGKRSELVFLSMRFVYAGMQMRFECWYPAIPRFGNRA